MNVNYILLGILGLIFCLYCVNGCFREGQQNLKPDDSPEDRKSKFTLETDIMRKFGDGCCRHRGSTEGAKDKGLRTIPECLNLCVTDPNCWAADYKNPRGDKYQCTTYTGDEEPADLHVECDKRTQCFKKVITGSAVCTVPQKCPVPPKEEKKLSAVVDTEEYEDKNEAELKILDQIQKGLKEIVGLAVPPSACEDDPLACRPGALTEDQFAEWLKAEAELTKETCEEPDPSDKCGAKPAARCPKDDDPEPPEKTLTESEISNVLKSRCEKQIAPKLVDPPNLNPNKPAASPKEKDEEKTEQEKLPPKSPEIVVDKPSVPPHYDDSHLGPKASPKSTSQSAPISGKFKVDGTSNESGASGGGSSSASDGNWEQVPHQHNKPLDGRNMNRELSTPAFNGEKKYVSMFE